jgi:hypothetical protein
MTRVSTILLPNLRITVLHVPATDSLINVSIEAGEKVGKADVVLRCFEEDLLATAGEYTVIGCRDEAALDRLAALSGVTYEPNTSKAATGLGRLLVDDLGAQDLELAQDDYNLADIDELTAYKRIVELYQAGAVIEYHDITADKQDQRFHVGFRYDCMSDDDYFELKALEKRFGIEGNPNWRGDPGDPVGRSARNVAAARS